MLAARLEIAGDGGLPGEGGDPPPDPAPAEDWRELRVRSGECASRGEFEAARVWAAQAAALAPDDEWEVALHWGALLNHLSQHDQALAPLAHAARLNPGLAEIFQQLAWAAERLGRPEVAAPLAIRAHRLEPDNPDRLNYAAHLVARLGQKREAAELLRNAPARLDMRLRLVELLIEIGDEDGAFDAFETAIADAACDAPILIRMAYLAAKRGEGDRAVALIEAAKAASPASRDSVRHAVTIYLEAGRTTQALAAAGELLRLAPDEPEYVSCMKHVLRVCEVDAPVALSPILIAKRAAGPPPPPRRRSLAGAARTQGRVIFALMLRETLTRYGDSKIGYGWALGELAIHIGVLALVFPFTMHGRPPIGDSFFFFYFTGLIPYLLFSHVSGQVGHGVAQNRDLLQLPQVTHFDVLLARGLLEFATLFVVALIFIAGFLALGVDAIPCNYGAAFSASLTVWLLAMGVGALSAVAAAFTRAFEHGWQIVLRLLYFGSGIFYTPGMMPEWVRDILAWNPLLQGVDWFRTAFFATYQPQWLDRGYVAGAGVFMLFLGLSLMAAFRRTLQLSR